MRKKIEKQVTVEQWEYYCDHCEKPLSGKVHLSIVFGEGYSGYVYYDEEDGEHLHDVSAIHVKDGKEIKQFCSTKCLGRFLS